MVQAAGKVRGMQEAERRWGEALRLFPSSRGFLHKLRGIPFGKEHLVAFGLKPLMQQLSYAFA